MMFYPEEDYILTKIITNKSSKSVIIITTNEQDNMEKGMESQYSTFELIKKVGKINRPEWWIIFIGLIASFICGMVYPLFSVIFGKVVNSFTEPKEKLEGDSKFWSLMFRKLYYHLKSYFFFFLLYGWIIILI